MAGPSLQLGVNAAGQETLAGLNQQRAQLRTNLTALKTGKADLSGIQQANSELKTLGKEMAVLGQGLKTSFAELAEAVEAGDLMIKLRA